MHGAKCLQAEKLTPQKKLLITLLAAMVISGCAGTLESALNPVTHLKFYLLPVPMVYGITAQHIDMAADNYATGLLDIQSAIDIKGTDIGKLRRELIAAKNAKGGFGGSTAKGIITVVENNKAATDRIARAVADIKWERLSPKAQARFRDAYSSFYYANRHNTDATMGGGCLGVKIKQMIDQGRQRELVLQLVGGLAGIYPNLNAEKIISFPIYVGQYVANLGSSLTILGKMSKVKDFSEEKKGRNEIYNRKQADIQNQMANAFR